VVDSRQHPHEIFLHMLFSIAMLFCKFGGIVSSYSITLCVYVFMNYLNLYVRNNLCMPS
jgi:hypothetical protein